MLSIQWKVPEREPPNGGPDAENACEASGTHALRVQVGGGASTPHGFPHGGKGFNLLCAKPPLRWAGLRFVNLETFPKGNGFILFASTKRTKSSRRAAALSTPGDGSNLSQLYFFVTFPALVPKPVCGATHFFGCFEPVRKGYCSADARPLFFGNGLPHCKLTEASHIQKG